MSAAKRGDALILVGARVWARAIVFRGRLRAARAEALGELAVQQRAKHARDRKERDDRALFDDGMER